MDLHHIKSFIFDKHIFAALLVGTVIVGYVFALLPLIRSGAIEMPFPLGQPGISTVASSDESGSTVTKKHDASKPWTYNFANLPDGRLSRNDWNYEIGNEMASYNNESQTYTSRPENVRIEKGALVIEARPEVMNGKSYTSARINTNGKFDFTYGTIEVDAMLPKGVGTWPAVWMMPSENHYKAEDFNISKDDKFHWALNGEIDFLEAIGSVPGQNLPAAHGYNEFHSAPTLTPVQVANPYTEYHRYGMIKTSEEITFTLDGVPYAHRKKLSNSPLDWPYDQPYYLIINLALGGNWEGVNGIDESMAPWQFKVKSISYRPLQGMADLQ